MDKTNCRFLFFNSFIFKIKCHFVICNFILFYVIEFYAVEVLHIFFFDDVNRNKTVHYNGKDIVHSNQIFFIISFVLLENTLIGS